jgi:predicted ABC-type exoprotein transport system permease subunit
MNQEEYEYRRIGRAILYFFLLYVPLTCLVLFIGLKLFHSELSAFVFAGLWMIIGFVLTVKRFQAYFRWKRRKQKSGL